MPSIKSNKKKTNKTYHSEEDEIEENLLNLDEKINLFMLVNVFSINQFVYLAKIH